MAFPAINLLVRPFQEKMGFGVVKLAQTRPAGKGLFCVALFTIGPKVVFVRIVVATVAIFEGHIGKPLKFLAVFYFFLVAFEALNRLVLAQKRKSRFIVVEFGSRRKFFSGVALGAIVAQCFLVNILVTGRALLL